MYPALNIPIKQAVYNTGMIKKEENVNVNQPDGNYNNQNRNMHNFNNAIPIPPPQQQMNMFINDWKSVLAPLKGCKIKQVFDNKEFLADFCLGVTLDFNNKYLILDPSTDVTKFVAYENSHFLSRNCLPKICIPLNMKITRNGKELNSPDILMEKDFTCTFCCINRPKIKLYKFSNNNNKELIGSIKAPFSCCSYKFDLFDASNNKIIYINDTCFQLGILCPLPCAACKYSHFHMRDSKTREQIAHLRKEVPFLQLVKTDIDNYTLDFEQVKNPEWKMMLLAFALFMDYIYYDYKR